MTEFGEFANVDVDRMLRDAGQQFAKVRDLQEKLGELKGVASSEDGKITATYTTAGGLTALELDPRIMRMASTDLAESILQTVHDAAADLQEQTQAAMAEVFGEADNPMNYLADPKAVEDKAQEMQDNYNRAMGDVMGELERIRNRLGL